MKSVFKRELRKSDVKGLVEYLTDRCLDLVHVKEEKDPQIVGERNGYAIWDSGRFVTLTITFDMGEKP